MSVRQACIGLATAVALIVGATPLAAQRSRAESIRLMDSIAGSPVVEGRVAGLAVAVVQGRDTLLWKAYGKADLEWDVPLTPDAVFEIGSVTKQFTATTILQLRGAGKLDLDAGITTYLPDYPTQGHRIPLRRLLDHTSGIKGYTEMRLLEEFRARTLPRDSLVARFSAEPFDFRPGDALIYNNSAYFLLGLIIEKVSGMSYEDYVEQKLFTPLGMSRSSYCSNSEVVPRRAHGYELSRGGLVLAPYVNMIWPYSAGALCSTIGDLITWLVALHGGKVLPAASYQELITPGRLNDGTPVRYAMGLTRAPDAGGRPVIGHGGAIDGFVSDTRYYPEADLYVVTLVNTTGNLNPAALAMEMVDVLLPRVPVARRPFTGDRTPLVGTYTGPSRGRPMSVRVSVTGDGLALAINDGPAQPLVWVDGWTFMQGPRLIIFERAGRNGPAALVRVDTGGGHFVLRRQGPAGG